MSTHEEFLKHKRKLPSTLLKASKEEQDLSVSMIREEKRVNWEYKMKTKTIT